MITRKSMSMIMSLSMIQLNEKVEEPLPVLRRTLEAAPEKSVRFWNRFSITNHDHVKVTTPQGAYSIIFVYDINI